MKPFVGIWQDLKARAPYYLDDYVKGFHPKVLAAAIFMFFTSIAPAITFAATLDIGTKGQMGAVEIILSQTICGVIFAIFAGQPLVIVGVTGPVSIFTLTAYELAKLFDINFLNWYAWIGLWAALMHVILAAVNACELVRIVTRFSCEVFGCLIAVIYIWNAVALLVDMFGKDGTAAALLSILLAIGTHWLATLMSGARLWTMFKKPIRTIISDYAAATSIVVFTVVQYIPPLDEIKIALLEVPLTFEPTLKVGGVVRSWLVPFWDCPIPHVFSAIVPALILTILFYFDHNVSSILAQKAEYCLKKPAAYNLDFLWIGIMIAICAILGIPPTNGLIPQAPLHTESLRVMRVKDNGEEEVEYVVEQRVSGLLQSVFIGCTLIPPILRTLGRIPIGVLCGLFLFMGVSSFSGNEFFERFTLFFVDKNLRERACSADWIKTVPFSTVVKFTMVQLVFLVVIFVVTRTPAAICFPVAIALLVPTRSHILPKFLGEEAVNALDDNAVPDDPVPIVADVEKGKEIGTEKAIENGSGNTNGNEIADRQATGEKEMAVVGTTSSVAAGNPQ
uniref:Bicarbonate transporter-like transmembrane domain-containing protein n=1 Tax=Eutreptiella gymnastica TaxID=73025 RepID=A0A7S1IDZ3_9EUGL|mmetsp:Transcript_150621/g.263253  ORF Transcript_150621/g.263253 Transcript_150621/m.263253 type:complete len:563 (+) Transcript_150621:48-1736(+)